MVFGDCFTENRNKLKSLLSSLERKNDKKDFISGEQNSYYY